MDPKFARKRVQSRNLSKLKPHPRQTVFRPHTEREIADLAELLDREGLISPVEITPDGYIICGHGRVAAARSLGWDTITCWVRRDLADEGEDAVFRRLVEDNLRRRPLSKLGLGRAYMALKEQEYDSWRTKEQEEARGDFRDYLGEVMGCDGTTAERWAKLAVLPAEYDQLIEANLLSQQQAVKIVKHLPADIRERMGRKLAEIAGKDIDRKAKKQKIRTAVNARLGSRSQTAQHVNTTWRQSLPETLTRLTKNPPAPIVEFVEQLSRSNGVRSLVQTLCQKYPTPIDGLRRAEIDLDGLGEDELKSSVLLILGLMFAKGVKEDSP